jgi:hypothetical protein
MMAFRMVLSCPNISASAISIIYAIFYTRPCKSIKWLLELENMWSVLEERGKRAAGPSYGLPAFQPYTRQYINPGSWFDFDGNTKNDKKAPILKTRSTSTNNRHQHNQTSESFCIQLELELEILLPIFHHRYSFILQVVSSILHDLWCFKEMNPAYV